MGMRIQVPIDYCAGGKLTPAIAALTQYFPLQGDLFNGADSSDPAVIMGQGGQARWLRVHVVSCTQSSVLIKLMLNNVETDLGVEVGTDAGESYPHTFEDDVHVVRSAPGDRLCWKITFTSVQSTPVLTYIAALIES